MMDGDRLPELIYLDLLDMHCTFTLEHCARLEAAFNAVRKDDPKSPDFADAALIKVLPAIVGCLTHAALVSGFLFPTQSKGKESEQLKPIRCSHFQDLLNVRTPTLQNRVTRDAMIHMDERLDKLWAAWQGDKAAIDYNQDGIKIIMKGKTIPILSLNIDQNVIEIFDGTLNLNDLTSDIETIKKSILAANKMLNNPDFVPLWRKFAKLRASA